LRPTSFERTRREWTASRNVAARRPTLASDIDAASNAEQERNMISRQWHGLARSERAQDYIRHLRTQTFPALREIPGFVDASILSRTVSTGVEFQIVTRWDSIDAIVEFAGADPEVSVVPRQVEEMMIEYDPRAKHFEVVV
jgi:heme-degrading monooxygenase HmoA